MSSIKLGRPENFTKAGSKPADRLTAGKAESILAMNAYSQPTVLLLHCRTESVYSKTQRTLPSLKSLRPFLADPNLTRSRFAWDFAVSSTTCFFYWTMQIPTSSVCTSMLKDKRKIDLSS